MKRSQTFRAVVVGFAVPALLGVSHLLAQDHVVLQGDGQSSRLVLPCQILDYTGEKLSAQLKSGVRKEYPADQVLEVRTDWLDAHERGRKLLAERKPSDATKSLQEALVAESRPWVRREILALLIRCALRQGDRVTASARFLSLSESDPKTRHFGLIPLVWASESVNQAAKSQAREWLTKESDIPKLLGASFLLDDPQFGESAARELGVLQRSVHESVRQLAQAQSWRSKLRLLEFSEIDLQRWDSRIREMPVSLRAGPSYLLGRGWAMRREHDRAATALLWLPLMDDGDPRLTARAGVEAADSLKRIGQTDAARRLLEEMAARFPDTEFGAAAK